jgi:large subunit ribosomal protein L25
MELKIECQKRPADSKPNQMRREGKLPAVLYGHNGIESVPLELNLKTAETLVKRASVNNTLIQLTVTDLPWSGKTLLREVQAHPWKGELYHLSFFSVAAHGDLEVTVPLEFVGVAIGVKNSGGVLDTVLNELVLKCPPEKIPETIPVDVSNLEVGDSIAVNQLPLPEGAVVLGESDRIIVSVLHGSGSAEGAAAG